MSLGLDFQVESPPHALREEFLPTVFPLDHLRQIATICGDMEAKFFIWGSAVLVQVSQTGSELMRVRHVFHHLPEFAEEKVRVWERCVRSPGNWFRYELG